MYVDVNLSDNIKQYKAYKLCYIEPLYPEGYELEERQNRVPLYERGKREYIAYFSPIEPKLQRGEDWEGDWERGCVPYDTILEDDGSITELNILQIPFAVASYSPIFAFDWWKYFNGTHDGFRVIDVNNKVVAWIYDYNEDTNESVCIYAGVSPQKFKKLLHNIKKNNKGYTIDE